MKTSSEIADIILSLVDVDKKLLKSGVFEAVWLEIDAARKEAVEEYISAINDKLECGHLLGQADDNGACEVCKARLEATTQCAKYLDAHDDLSPMEK